MPLGPELITSPEDRNFISSLGNWALNPPEPEWTFTHAGDPLGERNGCAKFKNLTEYLGSAVAILPKDYFGLFEIGQQYQFSFWGQREFSTDIIYINFVIRDSIISRFFLQVSEPGFNLWRQKVGIWTVPSDFQNSTRELLLVGVVWLPVAAVYANGLSIRKIITAKIDHLALMGVH